MPLTEQQKAEGWIEHDGGPCPVEPSREVRIMLRSGAITNTPKHASRYRWPHIDQSWQYDIIAYRPEPKP